MANAYATLDDYEARNGMVDDETRQGIIVTLLSDAALMLDSMVDVDPTDQTQLETLKVVSCNMVSRAMLAADGGLAGISQLNAGMGPFSQSATLANPSGDMYLTGTEKLWLGIGGTAIGSIRARVG